MKNSIKKSAKKSSIAGKRGKFVVGKLLSTRQVTVAELIKMLKAGKRVLTPGGVAHRLEYCQKVSDKTKTREIQIAA